MNRSSSLPQGDRAAVTTKRLDLLKIQKSERVTTDQMSPVFSKVVKDSKLEVEPNWKARHAIQKKKSSQMVLVKSKTLQPSAFANPEKEEESKI